jgi:hypothetical protein
MANVFISWGSPDRKSAQQLAARLKSIGLDVFFSLEDMYAGDQPTPRVLAEIAQARVAIVALSDESVRRQWVTNEIAWCVQRSADAQHPMKKIIPLIAGKFDPDNVPQAIKDQHRLDITDPVTREGNLERLIGEVACRTLRSSSVQVAKGRWTRWLFMRSCAPRNTSRRC